MCLVNPNCLDSHPGRQHMNQMSHLCQNSQTPGDPAETSTDDHDEQTTAEPVPHSSSSHWEWRPPPEPDDPVATRRRVVAKRPPTAAGKKEFRPKRMRSEPVPELFPLTGEELSEDVFEILIDFFRVTRFGTPSRFSWFRTSSGFPCPRSPCVHSGSRSCQTAATTGGSVNA